MEWLIIGFLALVGFVIWVWQMAGQEEEKEKKRKQIVAERRKASIDSLLKKLAGVNNPEKVRALCPHKLPVNLRLLRSELPLWVVPDCSYYRTVKKVSYVGGSSGASVRVARGAYMRVGGSRGEREETETYQHADTGTAVLTDRHLYFAGTGKERFRVRLDKLVSVEIVQEGILFQRDGVRSRPEILASEDAHLLAVLLMVIENDYVVVYEPDEDSTEESEDGVEVIAAHQASME